MSDTSKFAEKYGPWALIAGGSEGIGRSFALQLAAQGLNLILLARRAGPLEATADEIRSRFDVRVCTQAVDLTNPDLSQCLNEIIAGREIGMLIYNAGAVHGASLLLDRPLQDALSLVNLNCVGPLTLVHSLGMPMRARGRGGIVLMSSMSALGGVGYSATYSATKAFDRVLAEGLWWEFGAFGVDVLGLLAGATATPAMTRSNARFERAHTVSDSPVAEPQAMAPMDPDDVAREALGHLGKGPIWMAGETNRAIADLFARTPREEVIRRMSETSAKLYGLPLPGRFAQ